MTNKDILKAFSGLDADTVIACAPGGAPQRKNRLVLRVVAIAACLALLVSAVVVSTLLLNREDENQPDVPSDVTEPNNEKKKYEMYINVSAGESGDTNISANENVVLKPADQKNFSLFSSKNKIDRPENISDSIDIKIGGNSFSLSYDSAYSTELNNVQKFEALGKNIVYEGHDGQVILEVSSSTNNPVLFSNRLIDKNAEGDFDISEVQKTAETILSEMYEESFLDGYVYDRTGVTNDENFKMYTVYFKRNVWGFETDDLIMIRFNFKGELIVVNAKQKGIMEFAEEDLTKEEIEGAIAAVNETFSDSWLIGNHKIVLDAEGDYYLMTYLVHADGDEITEMRKVHTKIK